MAEQSKEERVARALWKDRYPDDPWDAAPYLRREDFRGHARAAIAAADAWDAEHARFVAVPLDGGQFAGPIKVKG